MSSTPLIKIPKAFYNKIFKKRKSSGNVSITKSCYGWSKTLIQNSNREVFYLQIIPVLFVHKHVLYSELFTI